MIQRPAPSTTPWPDWFRGSRLRRLAPRAARRRRTNGSTPAPASGIRINGQFIERGVVVVLVRPLTDQDRIAGLCGRDVDREHVVEDPVDVEIRHCSVV